MAITETLEPRVDAAAEVAEAAPVAQAGERDLRVQLAAAYRLVDHFGWAIGIYGHLTVRAPGAPSHFLINPFGLRYDEVTASNLVKIDCDGNVVEPSEHAINEAGFVIHSAVHMADNDNICVMHVHTRAATAVAATREGLRTLCQEATAFHGRMSYHDYEGISVRLDERERLLHNLGDNRQMILRNHGLLTTGRTIPEAFMRLWMLQISCENQVQAGLAGTANPIPDDVAEIAYHDYNLDDPPAQRYRPARVSRPGCGCSTSAIRASATSIRGLTVRRPPHETRPSGLGAVAARVPTAGCAGRPARACGAGGRRTARDPPVGVGVVAARLPAAGCAGGTPARAGPEARVPHEVRPLGKGWSPLARRSLGARAVPPARAGRRPASPHEVRPSG